MNVSALFAQLGIPADAQVTPFQNAEDGGDYAVWKITAGEDVCVRKKAKNHESAVYSAFLSDCTGAPRLLGAAHTDDGEYLLLEYIRGDDLCHCTRDALTAALDALITLQKRHWENKALSGVGLTFEESLAGRRRRGAYLCDPVLEAAYAKFLHRYETLPRTLCHDDLLPFNVRYDGTRAVILDWELAGILPYPVSLARLLAHGSEEPDAFFFMTEADKAYAVDYYYAHLIRDHGIAYTDYRQTVDNFLFYEYCEWIMLGNRYEDADMTRFRQYSEKARAHLAAMAQSS